MNRKILAGVAAMLVVTGGRAVPLTPGIRPRSTVQPPGRTGRAPSSTASPRDLPRLHPRRVRHRGHRRHRRNHRHPGPGPLPRDSNRLRYSLYVHSKYQLGAVVPTWLCGGTLNLGLGPVTEIAFNALHNRLGIDMPLTRTLTEQQRPSGTNYLFFAWQTLTHADNPA